MEKITTAIKSGRVLVSDGAWGTMLHQKGLKPGECPESWCLSRFDDIRDVAARYAEAGADMVGTNSFGANRFKLEHYGLSGQVSAINQAAAKASREAVGDGVWVIASIGPTGKLLVAEDVTKQELYEAFKEQAVALEAGGADAACLETMMDIDEAVQAIRAVKENTSLEVICSFVFERTVRGEYRTMMGVSPTAAAVAATEAGADVIGANCGNGIERMIEIASEMRAARPDAPILIHANAGLPQNLDGLDVFPDSPEFMARQVPKLIRAGANIVGGCCGATPAHIEAIAQTVKMGVTTT